MPAKKDKPAPPVRQPVVHEVTAKLEGSSDLRAGARVRRQVWQWVPEKPPGRPSSRDLIRAEAKRQLTAGSRPALKVLAGELSAWLVEAHPQAPAMAPSTVEDNIRDLWSAAGE